MNAFELGYDERKEHLFATWITETSEIIRRTEWLKTTIAFHEPVISLEIVDDNGVTTRMKEPFYQVKARDLYDAKVIPYIYKRPHIFQYTSESSSLLQYVTKSNVNETLIEHAREQLTRDITKAVADGYYHDEGSFLEKGEDGKVKINGICRATAKEFVKLAGYYPGMLFFSDGSMIEKTGGGWKTVIEPKVI